MSRSRWCQSRWRPALAAVLCALLGGCGGGRGASTAGAGTSGATAPAQVRSGPSRVGVPVATAPGPVPVTTAPAPVGTVAASAPAHALLGRPSADAAILSTGADATIPAGEILHARRRGMRIALTFDADMTHAMLAAWRSGRVPSGWYDRRLFAELRATRTPATIFLTGLWAQAHPRVVAALATDPLFELANHTLDHAAFATPCFGLPAVAGEAAKRNEIAQTRSIIERTAGVTPRYFRFPGGCARAADVSLVNGYGERPVLWDVVSGDAFQHDTRVIVDAVMRSVAPGSIIVAHCVGAPNTPATAAAMRILIPRLRARGYEFVTLSRLLAG